MAIGSVFQSGVSAYQAAQSSMQRSAHHIANASVMDPAASRNAATMMPSQVPATDAADRGYPNRRVDASSQASESLEESMINLRVQSYMADASVKVIKTADQLIGTLLDTRA